MDVGDDPSVLNKRTISTAEAKNIHEPPTKKNKAGRVCSQCKVSRSLDNYSKTQGKKGASAKCTYCVGKGKAKSADPTTRPGIALTLRGEGNAITTEHKRNVQTKRPTELLCSDCDVTKSLTDFSIFHRQRNGVHRVCKTCVEEQKLKAVEQKMAAEEKKKLREIEEKKKLVAEYDEAVEDDYSFRKERFGRYVKGLEENGIDINDEMTSPSDLVYVVTSVERRGDPFAPVLHGIYTTCKNAQDGARKAFENISTTYREGKFVSNDDRILKADFTEFLIPGKEFSSKSMFELFGEEEDDDCVAVAINAVRIDKNVTSDLPFLSDGTADFGREVKYEKRIESVETAVVQGTNVFAIFSYHPGNMGGDFEVTLCGVYTKKEQAVAEAKKFADFENEEDEKEQMDAAREKSNGMLFWDSEDWSWRVGIEGVALDKYHGKQLDLSEDDGVWMNPRFEFY